MASPACIPVTCAPSHEHVARTGVDPKLIDDAIIGCVTETGEQGACIGRAAVLAAGWPIEIPGFSLNRFCGSGQTAVNLGAQGVASGAYDLVYAGGVESMSRCPMGSDMGALPTSLTDRYNLIPQGVGRDDCQRWKYPPPPRRIRLESSTRLGRSRKPLRDLLPRIKPAAGARRDDSRSINPRPQTSSKPLRASRVLPKGKIHAATRAASSSAPPASRGVGGRARSGYGVKPRPGSSHRPISARAPSSCSPAPSRDAEDPPSHGRPHALALIESTSLCPVPMTIHYISSPRQGERTRCDRTFHPLVHGRES